MQGFPFLPLAGPFSDKMFPSKSTRGIAMRLITTLLLSLLSSGVHAADQLPDLQSVPPPPALNAGEAPSDEPVVTITKQTDQTVEEYRVSGKLYMIKITPKIGKPYYLVDDRGDGKFTRQESLDSGVRPPRWVLHRF
jgi:hypothetical protein